MGYVRLRPRLQGARPGTRWATILGVVASPGFRHLGVEFVSLREAIDTGSPLGRAVFTIIAAIAQLERSLTAERVRAGLRRAKADGKPRTPPRRDRSRSESVIRQGLSVRDGAGELGISAFSFARLARGCSGDGEQPALGTLPRRLSRYGGDLVIDRGSGSSLEKDLPWGLDGEE
jgi:hypothetical protein